MGFRTGILATCSWFICKKGAKLTLKIADKVSDFRNGRKTCLTIGKYKSLCKAIPGRKWRGIEVHHIIEQRLDKLKLPLNDYPAIPLDKKLHQKITKRWKQVIPYKKWWQRKEYRKITKKELLAHARMVYHDMLELRRIATKIINDYYKK